jgi:hypothetical protein
VLEVARLRKYRHVTSGKCDRNLGMHCHRELNKEVMRLMMGNAGKHKLTAMILYRIMAHFNSMG